MAGTEKKAVFLDRDGTVNIEKAYLYKAEDFVFERGAIDGLRRIKALGYLLIVVTNQSGIARGFYTEEDLALLNAWLMAETKALGCGLDALYYCPHHPDEGIPPYRRECDCRKPKTGMIDRAVAAFGIDRAASYLVGDKRSDLQTALNADLAPILVRTGYGRETEAGLAIAGDAPREVSVFDTLRDFADWLEKRRASAPAEIFPEKAKKG
ncbi:MAG: D-glycero-beta-D-manno-heptose 1,7-bisphosphate 7-phosphatase [Fusobacteriaceae bacterium]|jgi:D,D-heptose 1,7-bisphosphate phosphatase|nr:D-glycero-beta-D-manno-heptose 1,7-bisphosphate 7-phosphatase [Fusobacteriaceae bacterium]